MQRKFISIYLPYWSADLLLRSRQSGPESAPPLLFTAVKQQKETVLRFCPRARKAGVKTGMSAATARMLAGGAEAINFDLAKEAQALEQLALWAYSFSPVVAPEEPQLLDPRWCGITLDATGNEKLFGGDETLTSLIAEKLKTLRLHARVALAPTIGGAWALSRHARSRVTIASNSSLREALAPLPAKSLRLDDAAADALAEVNIKTIGDLLKLPRASLLDRFGGGLLKRFDQALGYENEVLDPLRPKGPLHVSRKFPQPLTDRETLKQIARILLEQLLQRLEQLEKKTRGLCLQLRQTRAALLVKNIVLSFPSTNFRHLWKLLENQLDALSVPDGIEGISLVSVNEELVAARHTNCVEPENNYSLGYEFGELLDTLREHLGSSRVLRVNTAASHIPERSFSYTAATAVEQKTEQAPLIEAERPSMLLSPPEPIRTMAVLPDSPPFWVQWREQQYQIITGIGPERIGSEWWRRNAEDKTRDYFRVQLATGTWLWVFRELSSSKWYLHGIWA